MATETKAREAKNKVTLTLACGHDLLLPSTSWVLAASKVHDRAFCVQCKSAATIQAVKLPPRTTKDLARRLHAALSAARDALYDLEAAGVDPRLLTDEHERTVVFQVEQISRALAKATP